MAEKFFPLKAAIAFGVDAQGRPVKPTLEFVRQWDALFKRVGEYEALTNVELEQLSDTRNETLELLSLAPTRRTRSDSRASGFSWNVRTITASANAYAGDYIDANATGGTITVTMPNVISSKGRMVAVSKTDTSANAVTISGTVNGSVNPSLGVQYTTLLMVSNGTEWRLI